MKAGWGGAYGEHLITKAAELWVDAPFFEVDLAPGAGTTLEISMKRYAGRPRYAFSWDRSGERAP